MQIKKRIQLLEDALQGDLRFKRVIYLTQKEPNSKEYIVNETYKYKSKCYTIDNLKDFYSKNMDKNTNIITINIVDNSHLAKYLYEEG